MRLIGIPLRRPNFGELTAAAAMSTGLWLVGLGLLRAAMHRVDIVEAGALLLLIVWTLLSVRLGIRVDQGRRHMAASLLVSAALLAMYKGAIVAFG